MEGFMPVMDMGIAMGMGPGGVGGADGIDGAPAQWAGDHSFSSRIVTYSLNNFVIPEVAKEHPTWAKEDIRMEARHRMAMRLWESRDFYNRERQRNPEIAKQWDIEANEEGVLELRTSYADKRVSLRELWEHTRQVAFDKSNPATYNPAAYNEQEAKSQLALQDALINGTATAAITMLSDVNSFRYAQIWEKKGDNTISFKVVDLGLVVGHDFSQEEATTILTHVGKLYLGQNVETPEVNTEYPSIMLSHASILTDDIKVIAHMQAAVFSKHELHDQLSSYEKTEELHSPRMPLSIRILSDVRGEIGGIVREARATELSVADFIKKEVGKEKKDKKKLTDETGESRDFSPQIILADILTNPKKEKLLQQLTTADSGEHIKQMDEEEAAVLWQEKAKEALNITTEQSRELMERMREVDEQIQTGQGLISFSVDTGVGVGAAMFALEAMATMSFEAEVGERPEIVQEKDGQFVLRADGFTKLIDQIAASPIDQAAPSEQKDVDSVSKKEPDQVVVTWLKEFVGAFDQKTPEQTVELVTVEQERVAQHIQEFWESLRGFIFEQKSEGGSVETVIGIEEKGDVSQEQHKKEAQYHSEQFAVGFTIWLLFKLSSYYEALESCKTLLTDIPLLLKQEKTSGIAPVVVSRVVKKRLSEALTPKEPTPWLLLSIIWHLTMIREMGMQTTGNVKQSSTGKKLKKPKILSRAAHFSLSGVIFALAS